VLDPNKPVLATLPKKPLEDQARGPANKPPIPNTQPNQQVEHVPSQSYHVSAFPQKKQEPRAVEGHVNDGYESEEYESIKENVSVLIGTQVLK
jgi:hypothetical protein